MKITTLGNKIKEIEMQTDEFGRLVIEDYELMAYVTGAAVELMGFEDNTACGSNGACGNAGCANVARCR